ncbi:hypothetical protein COBT_000423 [Conglomerata obtusa]
MIIYVLFIHYELVSCTQNISLQEYLIKHAAYDRHGRGANELFKGENQHFNGFNQTKNVINHENMHKKSNVHTDTMLKGFGPSNSSCPEILKTNNYCNKDKFYQTENKNIHTEYNNNDDSKKLINPNCNVFFDSSRHIKIASLPLDLLVVKKISNKDEKDYLFQDEKKTNSKLYHNYGDTVYYSEKSNQNECVLDKNQTENKDTRDTLNDIEHCKHENTKKIVFFDTITTPTKPLENKDRSLKRKNIGHDECAVYKKLLGNNSPKQIESDVKLQVEPKRLPITHNYGCKIIKVEYQNIITSKHKNNLSNTIELSLIKPQYVDYIKTDKKTYMANINISNKYFDQTLDNSNIIQQNTIKSQNKKEIVSIYTKKKRLHKKIARIHRMLAQKTRTSAQNNESFNEVHAIPQSLANNLLKSIDRNGISTQSMINTYKKASDMLNDTHKMHVYENFFVASLENNIALHKNRPISIYHLKYKSKNETNYGKRIDQIAENTTEIVKCTSLTICKALNAMKNVTESTNVLNIESEEKLLEEITNRKCKILKEIYKIRNLALCAFSKVIASKNYLESIFQIKNHYWIYNNDYYNYLLDSNNTYESLIFNEDLFSNLENMEIFIITEDMKNIQYIFKKVIYEGFKSHKLTFNILYDLFVLNTPANFTICDELMLKAKSLLINTNINNHKNIEYIVSQLTLLNKYLLFCDNTFNTIDKKEEVFVYICFLQLYTIYLSFNWCAFCDEINSIFYKFMQNEKIEFPEMYDLFKPNVNSGLYFIYHNQICLNDITAYLLWPILPKYCFEKYVCLIYFQNIHILARFMSRMLPSKSNHLKFYKTPINLLAKLFFASEIYIYDVFGETKCDISKINFGERQKYKSNLDVVNNAFFHEKNDLFGLTAYKYHIHISTFKTHFKSYLHKGTFWLVCNCYFYHIKSDVMNKQETPYDGFFYSNENTEMNISDFYFDLASKFTNEVLIDSCMSILTEKLINIFKKKDEFIL